MLIFIWILFSIFVGVFGATRKIGFIGAFLLSLLLSPILGLIFTMISKDKHVDLLEKQMLQQSGNYQRYNAYQQKSNYKYIILIVIIILILFGFVFFLLQMYL